TGFPFTSRFVFRHLTIVVCSSSVPSSSCGLLHVMRESVVAAFVGLLASTENPLINPIEHVGPSLGFGPGNAKDEHVEVLSTWSISDKSTLYIFATLKFLGPKRRSLQVFRISKLLRSTTEPEHNNCTS